MWRAQLNRQLASFRRGFIPSTTKTTSPVSYVAFKRTSHAGFKFLSCLAVALAFYHQSGSYSLDVNKDDETLETIAQSVSVNKGIPPFDKYIHEPLQSDHQLIGFGTRTVTFLKVGVYGLGIYINKDDIAQLPKILDSKFLSSFYEKIGGDLELTHRQKLELALQDPEISSILIENLLNSQIRFTAKIVPLRNTDFNHLRDGLIKSIMACPKSKQILAENDDLLPNGLDELRRAFGARRGSCPKGQSLYLEVLKDQSMVVRYRETKNNELKDFVLGEVKEPLVSKLLFMQYLSGAKPLSKETKDRACVSLASFC